MNTKQNFEDNLKDEKAFDTKTDSLCYCPEPWLDDDNNCSSCGCKRVVDGKFNKINKTATKAKKKRGTKK